jgi:hypothetical protein
VLFTVTLRAGGPAIDDSGNPGGRKLSQDARATIEMCAERR